MKSASLSFRMFLLLCVLYGHSHAIINGGFEQAGPVNEYFTPPSDWIYENYAGLHNSFTPEGAAWSIASPFEGDQFVVLSTGGFGQFSDAEIQFSQLSQRATFNEGQILSFAWFFGTTDYLPYDDNATARLVLIDPIGGLNEIFLVNISVSDVGSYGSTNGWQTVTYTFDNATAGQYDLVFKVQEGTDTIYSSYFAIDGVTVIPEPATILLVGLGGLLLKKKR